MIQENKMIKKAGLFIIFILFTVATAHGAENLKDAFANGGLKGEFRNFYYVRDFDESTDRRDIASGGMLYYRTDALNGISGGIAFYTGQSLFNDDADDVYGLLGKDDNGDHQDFSVLAEAFLQADFNDTTLKFGRQELETPFVNGDDNRLTPQSVEAYTLENKSIPGVTLTASYVPKMKGKAASEFVSMTEYAEVSGGKEPVILGGLVYDGVENLTLQIWDFYASELFNGIYLRSDYSRSINDEWSFFGAVQYLKQNDVGKMLGGPIDTYTYGFEVGLEGKGLQAGVGYGAVGDQDVLYPWGHDFIVSIMVNDLSRAEEKGILGAIKYDFSRIGISGLVGRVRHLDFNTPDSGETASCDFSETDLEIFYTFNGLLDGLGLKIRHAIVNKDESLGGEDYGDTRVMLSYKFKING
jgi:hypothetical protein